MICGVILAGGASRRMGGREKSFLHLVDQPLIAHVAARFAPQVERLAVSANGDPARFDRLGAPVLPDTVPGVGPLAGILAGLRWAQSEGATALATIASDTPFLPRDLVVRLAGGQPDARTPVMAETDGRRHAVAALIPVVLADALASDLETMTSRSVQRWLEAKGAAAVAFPVPAGEPDPFFNINTPEDLERATGFANAG